MSDAQKTLLNGAGLKIAIAQIDGKQYFFADDGSGTMVKMLHANTVGINRTVNLGFASWNQSQGLEYNGVAWQVGSLPEGITAPEFTLNDYIRENQGGVFDTSEFMSDRKAVYNNTAESGEQSLVLADKVHGNQDFYLESTFKKQETFNLSALRYGFLVGTCNVNLTWADNSLEWQMFSWAGGGIEGVDLTENQLSKWESTTGIRVGIARINKTFYLFVENESGNMEEIARLNGADIKDWSGGNLSEAVLNLELHAWTPHANGATYENIKWQIGTIDTTQLTFKN